MRYLRVLLLLVCGGVVLLAAALTALDTASVDDYLTRTLPRWADAAGYRLVLGSLDLNPWQSGLTAASVELGPAAPVGENQWVVRVQRVGVRVHWLRSLFGTLHLDLTLESPAVSGVLPEAQKSDAAAPGRDGGTPSAPPLVLHTLQVRDGTLALRDAGRDLDLIVGSVQVNWQDDAGGGVARELRVRWRGGEESLSRVEFSGARRFATLRVERLDLTGPRLRASARGRLGPWRLLGLDVEAGASLDGLPPEWLEALHLSHFSPLGGTVTLAGRLDGTTHEPEFAGTLEVRDGRFGTLHGARLRAELEADRRGLSLRHMQGASNVVTVDELSGRLRWDDGLWLQARGTASEYRLRPFMSILFPDDFFPVGLVADAAFEAEGPLYPQLALVARGSARVRDLDVTTGPEGERRTHFTLPAATLRTQLTVGVDDIVFGASRVETETVDLEVADGRIVYRDGLWFTTAAQVRDLTLARPLLPDWIEANGRATGRFGGPYRELAFAYDVDLPEVVVGGQPVGRLRGRGEFDLEDLRIVGGHLSGPAGEIFADGSVTLRSGGEHRWEVRWEQGDLAATAALLDGWGAPIPLELAGTAAAAGTLTGPLAEPVYSGAVELADLRADRFRVTRAQLVGTASPAGWRVAEANLEAYGVRATGQGAGDARTFDAGLRLEGLGVARFLDEIDVPLPVDGIFSGRVQAAGPYPQARVEVSGRVTSPVLYALPAPNLDLELALDRERLTLLGKALDERLTVALERSFVDGELEARVNAQAAPWGALPADLLPPQLGGDALSGAAELHLPPDGSLTARWEGVADGVRWQTLAVGAVPFAGTYRGGAVEFSASAWERSLRLGGLFSSEAGAPLELELTLARFSLLHLAPYLPVVSGVVDGRGRALLGWERWHATQGAARLSALVDLEMEAKVAGLGGARGLNLPDVKVRITSPDGLPQWQLTGAGVEVTGAVNDLVRAGWRAVVRLEDVLPWPLLLAGGPVAELSGRLSGAGWLSGEGPAVTAAAGSGQLVGLNWRGWGTSSWDWELTLDEGRLRTTLREPRGIWLDAEWDEAAGVAAELALRDVPLAGWLAEDGPIADLTGVVEGWGRLRWPPAGEPEGELELTNLALRSPPTAVANDGPVRLAWSGKQVRVEGLSLVGEGVSLSARGTAELGTAWNLEARGALELANLAQWLPQVERAQGRLKGALQVQGPWHEPQVRGPLSIVAGASLKLAGVPVVLEDLDAAGVLEGSGRFNLEWLDAQVREGRLHLEGSVDLDRWRPSTLRLYSEIRDLDGQWPAQVTYRLDADVLATGTVAEPQLRGEVRLQEFLYERNVNWRQLVLDALDRKPRQVAGQVEEGGVFVDLAVRGGEDMRVENNLANLNVAVDLRARGYLPNPSLWGRLDVVDGTVRFRGREYEALQSTVEFLGDTQPVPQLALHAQTQTRDYTVNVDVTGPLDDYQISLSSVPYLTYTDIVGLLALGMTSQEMQTSENVAGVEAASILAEGLQEEFSAVTGLLGVDQFYIDPSYSPATQTTVPRITIGKAITEELNARYSAAVGDETQQNVELQYSISPRISLLGTWIDRGTQERGSLGGEVRFRFPFR